jgi:hypothetical protein
MTGKKWMMMWESNGKVMLTMTMREILAERKQRRGGCV